MMMVGKKGCLLLVALLCLFVAGCVVVKGYGLFSYHVTGQVVDADGRGLGEVKIYFIDEGFDKTRSKDRLKATNYIGSTDKEGKFDISQSYWWRFTQGPFRHKPKQAFAIALAKEGYVDREFVYKAKELVQKDDVSELDMGVIKLMRKT